jgi:uncharacterized protein Usg
VRINAEFHKIIFEGYTLVVVNVLYWMPDQPSLVNEFTWETLDLKPRYPRINEFLSFWEKEIDARIKEVVICDKPHLDMGNWRNGILIPSHLE